MEPPSAPARQRTRAILFGFIAMIVGGMYFFFGLFIGIMATDACSGMPEWVTYWLLILWPAVLVFTIAAPTVMLWRGAPAKKVYRVAGIGAALSLAVLIAWFPILGAVC